MAAKKGNSLWEMRSSHGRTPIYETPQELWDKACAYFEWSDNNPFQGKPRPYTLGSLSLYLGISQQTLTNYGKKDDDADGFFGVVEAIKTICYEQKFAGASTNIFNSQIIIRDLGLKEQISQENNNKYEDMTKDELAASIAKQIEG